MKLAKKPRKIVLGNWEGSFTSTRHTIKQGDFEKAFTNTRDEK